MGPIIFARWTIRYAVDGGIGRKLLALKTRQAGIYKKEVGYRVVVR